MDISARNIVESMNYNIFSAERVDARIREEVPLFKKILHDNINNHEVFHGYINKINDAWGSILKENFKRLIMQYNYRYGEETNKQLQMQNELVKMADDYNSKILFNEIQDMSLSGSVSSLTGALKLTGISKKKPSKRRR
jgi:hypothetical protein